MVESGYIYILNTYILLSIYQLLLFLSDKTYQLTSILHNIYRNYRKLQSSATRDYHLQQPPL